MTLPLSSFSGRITWASGVFSSGVVVLSRSMGAVVGAVVAGSTATVVVGSAGTAVVVGVGVAGRRSRTGRK